MANILSSSNMNLPIPQVGVEAGPTWAQDINNSLTIIDGHDHSAGSGVQITPSGLNINSDLTFNNNNAISFRSVRMTAQPSALAGIADLGCLYETGVDLYFNDGSGNQIRLTQSGAVAGTAGSISNLVSPASASYSVADSTFIFQSNVNTPAKIDVGTILLRNDTASSKSVSLAAPAAMAADTTITMPNIPSQTEALVMDNTGTITAFTFDSVAESFTALGANAILTTMDKAPSTWSPIVTPSAGTITQGATVAKYYQVGKFIYAHLKITFNQVGSNAVYVSVNLPFSMTVNAFGIGQIGYAAVASATNYVYLYSSASDLFFDLSNKQSGSSTTFTAGATCVVSAQVMYLKA